MIKYNYINATDFIANNPGVNTSGYTAATLSGIISKASGRVDSYLGYSLIKETIIDELHEPGFSGCGDLIIFPNKRPVIALTAASLIHASTEIDITLITGGANLYSIIDNRQINLSLEGLTTITTVPLRAGASVLVEIGYTAGYVEADLPEWAKDATELFTRDILARQMNIAGAKSIRQGSVQIDFGASVGSQATNEAEAMLKPYRRVT